MEYIYKINKFYLNINNKINFIKLKSKFIFTISRTSGGVNLKFFFMFFILILIKIFFIYINENNTFLNSSYIQIQNKCNISFNNKIKSKINLGIYAFGIKNGGRARSTSLIINYFKNISIFNVYLFTRRLKEDDEYTVPNNIKRVLIKNNLINKIKKYKIDVLIYQLSLHNEIKKLNDYNKIKVIFYQHLGVFDWIYGNYTIFKTIYRDYLYSKYVVNIIPYENYYLFKKWGINSIYMNNFMTYNFSKILQSQLSNKRILMIGRGDAKKKRFELGIIAMEYINQEIPQCELIIISDLTGILRHENLIINLNLSNNIIFAGYTVSPEIYYQNASLNIVPSISEAFPLVICETKIYGIPNLLMGLDYTSISEGGTVIIYDETPESFAKAVIKQLENQNYRNILGNDARKSMKQFNNNLLLMKWIKLILSIYNGDIFYNKMKEEDKYISENILFNVINQQIYLFKKRIPIFNNITIKDFENFSYMEKYNIV